MKCLVALPVTVLMPIHNINTILLISLLCTILMHQWNFICLYVVEPADFASAAAAAADDDVDEPLIRVRQKVCYCQWHTGSVTF